MMQTVVVSWWLITDRPNHGEELVPYSAKRCWIEGLVRPSSAGGQTVFRRLSFDPSVQAVHSNNGLPCGG